MMDIPQNGRAKAFDTEKLGVALQKAGHEARRRHALEGRSVPILRDGKIVWLTPEMILAADALYHAENGQQDTPPR